MVRNIGDYASASSHSDPVECAHQAFACYKDLCIFIYKQLILSCTFSLFPAIVAAEK